MNWLRRFMIGRHGPDELSFALLIVFILCWILSMFFPSSVWFLIELLLIIVCYYRMFSKNHFKRSQENARFLRYYDPIRFRYQRIKKRFHDRKTHKYFTCPSCGQELRVPKGRGEITITCPKCKNKFDKRT